MRCSGGGRWRRLFLTAVLDDEAVEESCEFVIGQELEIGVFVFFQPLADLFAFDGVIARQKCGDDCRVVHVEKV